MVYYHVHKNPQIVPILSQMNPVYNSSCIKHFNRLSFQNSHSNTQEKKSFCKMGFIPSDQRSKSEWKDKCRTAAALLWEQKKRTFYEDHCYQWNMDTRFWARNKDTIHVVKTSKLSLTKKGCWQDSKKKTVHYGIQNGQNDSNWESTCMDNCDSSLLQTFLESHIAS